VFECDPSKRITIPELRQLIVECPCFTETPVAPWVPDQIPQDLFVQPMPFVPVEPLHAQPSGSSSDSSHYSDFSESAVSDSSALTEDYSEYDCMSPVISEQVQVPNCKVVFPHSICADHSIPADTFTGHPIPVC
jgi:hypothetical protein